MREQLTAFLQSLLNSLAGEYIALGLIAAGALACLIHAEDSWQKVGSTLITAGTTKLGTKL